MIKSVQRSRWRDRIRTRDIKVREGNIMNLEKTDKIEKEIVNLPVKELNERIENAKSETDKRFWLALKNRGLQYKQMKVINEKEFIR